ncbi:hypothetical protein Slin15195_G080190 [Septoria linicola]|uniref:Uncharacterized protein n=1 Tax=Septoria linicola TaxID=215465 RepID=A0A9Q9AY80_9PEZI|nr:hypothetical protein Slin15195_G080190 [Septoria linicola]
MLRTLLVAGTIGLAAALPRPQNIDFAAVDAIPTPAELGAPLAAAASAVPTYVPEQAAAKAASEAASNPITKRRSLVARAACDPRPLGQGAPDTSPDTPEAFQTNFQYRNLAVDSHIPQGYDRVFNNLKAANKQDGYLGFYTLSGYDTIRCRQYCDATKTCTAFNTYIERSPRVEPGAGCENPHSTPVVKCALFGLPVSANTATNDGQFQADFHVVIAGSNGFVKNAPPPSQPKFTGPKALPGAINAPNESNSYVGVRTYNGPYDPSQCAAAAKEHNAYWQRNTPNGQTYKPVNFFVAYVVSKNNQPKGTYCALYDRPWDSSFATNTGQYDNEGNYYDVSQAYSYTLSQQDSGIKNSTISG